MAKGKVRLRVATGVIGGGAIILLTYLGAWPIGMAMLVVGLATQLEIYRLYKFDGKEAWQIAGLLLGAVLFMNSLLPGMLPTAALIIILLIGWASIRRPADVLIRLRTTVFCAIYPTAMIAFLIGIRSDTLNFGAASATSLTILVLIIIWATDTCAYLVGSAIGRHRLAARISPSKTVEGAIGGVIGALLAAVAFELSIGSPLSRVQVLVLALLCSLATQAGDLFASRLKRRAHVEDSGSILPGHGGLLDRFDGAIFASPVAYYYLLLVGVISRS